MDGSLASLINLRTRQGGDGLSYGGIGFSDDTRRRGSIDYLHNDGSGNEFMRFNTASAERLRISSAGNVSIHSGAYGGGGTAPQLYVRGTGGRQVKIHNSDAGTSMLQITNGTTGEGEDAGTQLFTQGSTGDFHIRNHFATGDLVFATKESGGSTTEKVRISSGDVASFGNSSPPAWQTGGGYYNLQLGNSGYFRADTDASGNFLSYGVNAYRNSSGWVFKQNGRATQVNHGTGTNAFTVYTSNSGNANNAITFTERFRIDADGVSHFAGDVKVLTGDVIMGNGRGMNFSATSNSSGSMSSETFDDYEEGQWTPSVNVGTVGVADLGKYTKIGNVVNLQVLLYNFSNTSSTSSIIVTGVPFACSGQAVGNVWLRRTTTGNKNYSCVIGDNATNSIVIVCDSDGNNMGSNLQYSHFAHSTPYMNITITYRTS